MEFERPLLPKIAPALDLILGFPSDCAHSELQGITKDLHVLIIKDILVPTATVKYTKVLRTFPKPTSWGPFQSPCYSLRLYSISDHGR